MQGLIPQPFIDELISRTDVVELIDSYVPLKKMGNSYVACCPFHSEKNPSFNVVEKKQFYHCFGCGASGNAIGFVMSYLQKTFPEAIELLAARVGMEIPQEEGRKKQTKRLASLYQLLAQVSVYYEQLLMSTGQAAKEYLSSRGINNHSIQRFQLGYAPSGWHALDTHFKSNKNELIASGMLIQRDDGNHYDRYRHRLMFPIHDRQGRIVGFGGRALDDDQKPKYLNSPETAIFQKNRELYGLYQVLQHDNNPESIIIVEGYLDVIALSQYGINHAVATLGTATGEHHIQLLNKYTKQVLFCFDGDAAGTKAAWRALENSLPHLHSGLAVSFIFLPEGHDPDSLVREQGQAAFLECIKQATPLNEYFFRTLTQGIDTSNLSGKSQLVNAVKPHLLKMPDSVYKTLFIDELSRITRIELHRLKQLLADVLTDKPLDLSPTLVRTPLRIAIALLLQHPELYTACSQRIANADLDLSKQTVLIELMEKIKLNPSISTAGLVELWRNTALFDSMNRLATWEHQVPEQAMERELIDTIQFLAKLNRDESIQFLLNKARQSGLTDGERHQLQAMLKQRQDSLIKKEQEVSGS